MSDETKLALVTGASRGLGAALAEAFATAGCHVLAVARTTGGLEELDDRIQAAGGSATLAPMDVTDPKAMEHLAGSILSRWGGLAVWAHTAVHAPPQAPAGHIDAKDLAKSVATNLTATAGLIPVLDPILRASGGTAVFFDDTHHDDKFFGAYGASKAAVISVARSAALALAPYDVRVNAVCPGVVETDMTRRLHQDRAEREAISQQDSLAGMTRRIPLGRAATPDEVADAIAYLLGPSSSYVTGQALNVCGGMEMT